MIDPSKIDCSALVFQQMFQLVFLMFHLVPHADPAKHVAGNEHTQYLLCLISIKNINIYLSSEPILQLFCNLHLLSKM